MTGGAAFRLGSREKQDKHGDSQQEQGSFKHGNPWSLLERPELRSMKRRGDMPEFSLKECNTWRKLSAGTNSVNLTRNLKGKMPQDHGVESQAGRRMAFFVSFFLADYIEFCLDCGNGAYDVPGLAGVEAVGSPNPLFFTNGHVRRPAVPARPVEPGMTTGWAKAGNAFPDASVYFFIK